MQTVPFQTRDSTIESVKNEKVIKTEKEKSELKYFKKK